LDKAQEWIENAANDGVKVNLPERLVILEIQKTRAFFADVRMCHD
jgi:hypothetical protein